MHDIVKVFAQWRIQAEVIGGGFQDRNHVRLAKRLFRILDEIDTVWLKEYGADYLNEMVAIQERHDRLCNSPEIIKKGDIH